ncbi:hypothetical protein SEEB0220_25105 [Salmonella enterica subsp. enterica serovar Bareilly str. CFSAN000220]|uniref:ead/Ea22-like family protein n=1 Tax=Salmonella enterica TaxID=28901 RepID=UPI000508BC63|nr:ead/Ea22-like family protein [Salmonella enterica]KFT25423.1 hypothetical protein EC23_12955 [Salmonella enterica subsp. enterica serovar Bareilly str. CFSAN000219]KGE45002.1 hypothetical protein SEEB0220_25105 [Salmonella enterica subsp. enterica serovar Bareilly str. CFSAN000220]
MSNIDKQALRERYSPKPAPECHICGAEMTIQRMSAGRITYGCTGATYDDKGCHYAEGRSIADDHYEQSRVTVVDVSDPDVLALLDELEHYKSREERVTKLVMDNSTSWDALYKKLEAAEKRTAELERANAAHDDHINQQQDRIDVLEKRNAELGKYAGEMERYCIAYMEWSNKTDWVQSDKRFDVVKPLGKHRADVLREYVNHLESRTVTVKLYDDFQLCHYGTTEDYAKGYIDSQNNFIKWLAAAGIKVKGE